jgi:hypothetical protein
MAVLLRPEPQIRNMIVCRAVEGCSVVRCRNKKQRTLRSESRLGRRRSLGVRGESKTNNSRSMVGRRIEYGSASERSRTATEQTPNKPLNPSGGSRVFCLPSFLAAAGLAWTFGKWGVIHVNT